MWVSFVVVDVLGGSVMVDIFLVGSLTSLGWSMDSLLHSCCLSGFKLRWMDGLWVEEDGGCPPNLSRLPSSLLVYLYLLVVPVSTVNTQRGFKCNKTHKLILIKL